MAATPDLTFLTDGSHEQVVFVTHRAARTARAAPLPEGLAAPLTAALQAAGLHELYTHQRETFDLLAGGSNVVVATGTASGKSLCFMLPVLQTLADDPQARALFLYPTKALAQDQARQIAALRPRTAAVSLYDGDTPQAQRAAIRKRAAIVLSNPDMLHMGILPGHEQWAEFLHHLRYVVVDEAHVYRGVFGSHVAQVLRRLRRGGAGHRAPPPQFVLSSATMAHPQPFAEELVGLPFAGVTESGAPIVEQTIVLWNPPLEDPALGLRKSALAEVSFLISESVLRGARVIAFAPTRKATELVYQHVKRRLDDRRRGSSDKVLPYRAGYTPRQRRDIERKLFDGELSAVVTTDALELGIDVGSLDLALVTGFPGTVMSLLQRWGRAGRRGKGHAVMVAGQDALDQYFMREPERLLSRAVEEAIVDLTNPHILEAHVGAAAYERPLTGADETYFGEAGMARAAQMAASGRLRRRTDSAGRETLAWSAPHSPAPQISLRSASPDDFVIVETTDGSVLGSVDRERVFRVAHPEAVYLHLGQSYLVTRLDLEQRTVLVDEFRGGHFTQPKVDKEVTISGGSPLRPLGEGAYLHFGTIDVTEQVIAYRKRELADGRVIDTVSLDLPRQAFSTEALWFTVPTDLVRARLGDGAELGALHAAEHACIAAVPLFAMCDRWDIGGLSANWHWQTDQATIFIYDGCPGGIGLARRAADAFEQLVADARLIVSECPCEAGCPSCVQSPKCGNLNEPLSKEGAVALLEAILAAPADKNDEKVGT